MPESKTYGPTEWARKRAEEIERSRERAEEIERILDPETGHDRADRWLAEDAGRVPGGEIIGYPVETSDRPIIIRPEDVDAFVKNFVTAFREIEALRPEEMDAIIAEAKQVVRGMTVEGEAAAEPTGE